MTDDVMKRGDEVPDIIKCLNEKGIKIPQIPTGPGTPLLALTTYPSENKYLSLGVYQKDQTVLDTFIYHEIVPPPKMPAVTECMNNTPAAGRGK